MTQPDVASLPAAADLPSVMAESLFPAIIESSNDAILSKTLDGVITSWNPAATRIFGYSAEEMLGQSVLCLFPAERLGEETLILQKIARGERVDSFETVRLHKSGRPISVSVTVSPVRNAAGRIVGASKIARDITAEIDNYRQLDQFRSLVTSSFDAILTKDMKGIVRSWNPACERIFGYTAAEMVGQPIQTLIPPERLYEEQAILARIQAGERIKPLETERLRKGGERIHVSITLSPLHDAKGRIIGASKIVRDITERHRSEQRMRLMDSVFSHTTEAIVVTDERGTIIEINDAFSAITGYERHEVIGRDPSLFRSGRQGPEVYRAMLSTLLDTGHCQGEAWSRKKTGEAYAVMLTVSAVPNPGGGALRYVALFSDITSLREQQEKLERLASYDTLTELPNRLLFSDRLRQALVHALRQKHTVAVAYLDLDGFKAVNDRWGHDAGDELLVTLARRMQSVFRVSDTLARIGGDEFAVVLVDVGTAGQCETLLNRILGICAEPVSLQGTYVSVSASIGVTLFPQDNGDADQLVRHADQAMYQAKQLGKNRFQLFDPASDAAARVRAQRLTEFSRAMRDQELVLHYQPKVNMRTGEVVGLEALIRWAHPERGLLPPAEFLPLIENHALIEAVGEWVIETALTQLQTWNAQGLRVNMGINIAPQHLKAENFVHDLLAQLAVFPLVDPEQLELEIVESSSIEDPELVMDVIARCQRHGLQFALDDFGTGYSSLTYLKQLKVNSLKIDQSFVRDMLVDAEDMAIVQGVISLANAFGKSVVAEGVESRDVGCRLLALGCELAQGFGISKPLPADEVPGWIERWSMRDSWALLSAQEGAPLA